MEIYVVGCASALVPDMLRVLGLARENKLGEYFTGGAFIVSLVIQIILAAIAVYLFEPSGKIAIFCTGFAAPEIISRAVAGFLKGGTTRSGAGLFDRVIHVWGK